MATPTPIPAWAAVDSPLVLALVWCRVPVVAAFAFEVGLEFCLRLCDVDVDGDVAVASNLDIDAGGKIGAEAGVKIERLLEAHSTLICGRNATKDPVVAEWLCDAFGNCHDP